MQEEWMTSKHKKFGTITKVDPYIEEGEYRKYLITHEQEVTEVKQFGYVACEECEQPIEKEPLLWKYMDFCSWKCLKKYMDDRGEE